VLAQLAQRGTARAIVDGIVASVAEFTRSQTGSDDITAVVIRREGKRRRA
jgi:serine phosphatase RsbU (regulator of sigma subunit)